MDDLAKNFISENLMLSYKIIRTTIIDLNYREHMLNYTKKRQCVDDLARDWLYESLVLPYVIIRTTIIDLDF
jgi:hypothetical protein